MKYQKLSEYAKQNGIKYGTAYLHYQQKSIPNVKVLDSGTILVGIEEENNNEIKKENERKIIEIEVNNRNIEDNITKAKNFKDNLNKMMN